MLNARQQAEQYAKALPAIGGWPPFIFCDVGHCFEIYADFTGQGKNYAQFPDRQGFRIYLEELRQAEIRERLPTILARPAKARPNKNRRQGDARGRGAAGKSFQYLEERAGKDGNKLYGPEPSRCFSCAASSRCLPRPWTWNCCPRTAFAMFSRDARMIRPCFRALSGNFGRRWIRVALLLLFYER